MLEGRRCADNGYFGFGSGPLYPPAADGCSLLVFIHGPSIASACSARMVLVIDLNFLSGNPIVVIPRPESSRPSIACFRRDGLQVITGSESDRSLTIFEGGKKRSG